MFDATSDATFDAMASAGRTPPVRYDYVIVGAGAAGCVLAGRLASGGRRVLLLEAGPDSSPAGEGSASFFENLAEPGRTHHGFAVEATHRAAPRPYQLGRGIGGGSVVNAMIATPGSPADYDHWERDFGCSGWGWSSMSLALEAQRLPVSRALPKEWGSVDRALFEAAVSLGHTPWSDHELQPGQTPRDELGVGPAWLTRTDGRRVSAADAYLGLGGELLTIRADAVVDRIALEGREARGVLTVDGEFIEAAEVIVCAGAIHSAAILLRSHVERAGVGHGLKDHPSSRFSMRLREPNDPLGLAASTLLRWSSTGDTADLQLLALNHLGSSDAAGGMGALIASVMSVHSTGVVATASDDPLVQPIVRLNLLDDERDRRRLREATRHMVTITATAPFRRIATDVYIDDRGTPLSALAEDDLLLDSWLIANVGDHFHAACTCRMGPIGDDSTVVDTAGSVHGYNGLRVCDASIFPDLPRANPYLPTVMVAERIAAMITAAR